MSRKSASPPQNVPVRDLLDSLAIWVPPGEGRPFILANRSGTYFYGSTGSSWDSGWMGLWVHRKRVINRFTVRNADNQELPLSEAWCRVTPADILWQWPGKTAPSLRLFFASQQDTLYYHGSNGIRIENTPWIQPSSSSGEPPLRRELLSELNACLFSCTDTTYTKAVRWAHLQMLFLLAEDDSLLYAGIPWFNEGWGRDTFISLPGLLVTGHVDIARKLLLRFADWLDRNPASPTYGRIPNRVRPGEDIAFNTADGTPWWILGLYKYGLYNRDYALWERVLLPSDTNDPIRGSVVDAVAGALRRTDSLGFLIHGDADTWMDAVGPSGPVTPRGNRAVEISALHHASLDAALRMASAAKNFPHDTLSSWRQVRRIIENNFLAEYCVPSQKQLWDRLRADGTPDSALRPNQIFALTVPLSPLLPPQLQTTVLKTIARHLIHEYGVLSLAPTDSLFHPFHMDEHYPKDDAYHNGIVWTWLSGPAKTALVREGRGDLALQMADYEADLLSQRGCVGSLPEATDAMPHTGATDVNLSGTISQTWSLAEFLRTTYQDFLGIRPVQIAGKMEPFWLIDPRIPEAWGQVRARIVMEQTPFLFEMQNFGDSLVVTLLAEKESASPVGIKAFHESQGITGFIRGTEPVRLVYRPDKETAYADGTPTAKVKLSGWPYDDGPRDIAFAEPIKMRDFPSLRPPQWDILTAAQIKRLPSNLKVLTTADDPKNDDNGSGNYVYPRDEHFAPGILDITRFEVSEDPSSHFFKLTFRNLVQPGWHPEYGFQLTFAAICLHSANGSRQNVGANSNYQLPADYAASRIIYIGGGIRMEDDKGSVLAQYAPRHNSDAFGDASAHIIAFSLPKEYFPQSNSPWKWTVLVGAQDDHGGAGMGEFRAVKVEPEQWAGGGNPGGGSNIYDILTVP